MSANPARWLLALLALASTARAEPPEVAVVTDLMGQVQHQRAESHAWTTAALDEGLALLDLVRTGVRSKTEMRFVDHTVLGVGERTRLRISLALFDVQAAPEAIRVALLAGHIDAAVAQGGRPLEVRPPEGPAVRLLPGRRARVRLVDGRLVVEALPASVRFAADPYELGQIPLDALAPDAPLAPGGRAPGVLAPGDPLGFDPWSPEAAAPTQTGVDVVIRPDGTP